MNVDVRRLLRSLSATVGTVAVLVAVAALGVLVVIPAPPDAYRALLRQVSTVVPVEVALWLAVVLWLYGVWRVIKRGYATPDYAPLDGARPPPEAAVTDADVAGEPFDDDHARAVAEVGPQLDEQAVTEVRTHLRRVATDLLAEHHPSSEDDGRGGTGPDVETRLDRGTWTDDEVAAAFLGADGAHAPSLRERVRAWLFPRAVYRERVDRTVRAIEARVERSARLDARTDGGAGGSYGAPGGADE